MKRPNWTWAFPRHVYVSIDNASSIEQLLLRSYPKLGKAVGPGGYAVVVSWRTLCRRSIVYPIGLIGKPSHSLTHLRSNAPTNNKMNSDDLSADNPRMVHGSARSISAYCTEVRHPAHPQSVNTALAHTIDRSATCRQPTPRVSRCPFRPRYQPSGQYPERQSIPHKE